MTTPRRAPPRARTPSGLATERGNAAAPAEVGAMFDRISARLRPDEPGHQRASRSRAGGGARSPSPALKPGGRAIDVATGTGKVAADLLRVRRSPAARSSAWTSARG